MKLLPLGQQDSFVSEDDYFFEEPMETEEGMTISQLEDGVLPPPTDKRAFFLHRFYSDTKARWEMLTGMDFETSTPSEIADAFTRVVKKHVEKPGPQRDAFSGWEGHNTVPPTPAEQAAAEQAIRAGKAKIVAGTIVEGSSPDDQKLPMMHVDYYVMVDPSIASQPDELAIGSGLTDRTKLAGTAGLIIGGLGTALLVKKGFGLKLLAGVAGGVITAGIFMQAAHMADQREVL